MLVHLFGATSSPSCSNYALKKTAEDSRTLFATDVFDTVLYNLFVDDCLKSQPSEEAMQMVKDLTAIYSRGKKIQSDQRAVFG